MVSHLLLEFLERPAQARRARGRADSEHARRRPSVELEEDAQRDDFSLAGGELGERRLERRRQAAELPLLALRRVCSVGRLSAAAPVLGAEVVERGVARDLAEPGARRGAARVEAAPRAERLLEGLAGQVLGG